jgi:hypothetical protein
MNKIKTSSFYITIDWSLENLTNDSEEIYNLIISKLDFNNSENEWYKLLENIYNTENNKNFDGYVHSVVQKENISYIDWINNKENINPINTFYITCYLLFNKDNNILIETQIESIRKAIIKHLNKIHNMMKIINIKIEDYEISKHHDLNSKNSFNKVILHEI